MSLPNPDDLTPEWYHDRPIPERLIKKIGQVPIIPEGLIPNEDAGAIPLVKRRRDCQLTNRETQILALQSHGLTTEQIGDTLDIGFETIKSMMKKVRYVLRAKNTMHAVAIAIREGIIE